MIQTSKRKAFPLLPGERKERERSKLSKQM